MTHKAQFSCSIIYISVSSIEGFAGPEVNIEIYKTQTPFLKELFFFFFLAEQGNYIQVTVQIQILGIYNTNTG